MLVSSPAVKGSVFSVRFASAREKRCPSAPPSRPRSPLPPSRHEPVSELLRKARYWQAEMDTHQEKAMTHTLSHLMSGSRREDTLSNRHTQYADRCEKWHKDVMRELKRKLNLPQQSSPLSRELKPEPGSSASRSRLSHSQPRLNVRG